MNRFSFLWIIFVVPTWIGLAGSPGQALGALEGCRDYGSLWETHSTLSSTLVGNNRLTYQDGLLYIASSSEESIRIVDVSDPEDPALLGTFAAGGVVTGLASRTGDLLVTVEGVGLRRFDLTDPLNPALMTTLDLGFQHNDVVLDGHMAYVALGGSGVRAVSLEYPGLTLPMGLTSVGGAAKALAVADGALYVGSSGWGW